MTQAELVTRIAERSEDLKEGRQSRSEPIGSGDPSVPKSRNGAIRITDLGTFKVARRNARNGVNPRTLEKMKIPASKVPSFRAANALKESASGGGKHSTGMRSQISSAAGQFMCKVCGLPVVGELPYCKEHQKTAC